MAPRKSKRPWFCFFGTRCKLTFFSFWLGLRAAKGQTRFYLLHLSLLREFLDLEFGSVKTELTFAYDVERIIDDFVLIAYFVGNDFLPSLPSLYIPNGSLAVMFQIYKQVLPKLGNPIFSPALSTLLSPL